MIERELAEQIANNDKPMFVYSKLVENVKGKLLQFNDKVQQLLLKKLGHIGILLAGGIVGEAALIIRPEAFQLKENRAVAVGLVKVTLASGDRFFDSSSKAWKFIEHNKQRAWVEFVGLNGKRQRYSLTFKNGEWVKRVGHVATSADASDIPEVVEKKRVLKALVESQKEGKASKLKAMKLLKDIDSKIEELQL